MLVRHCGFRKVALQSKVVSIQRACRTLRKRIQSAVIWTVLAVVVFGIILALVYAINGEVEYDTNLLTSGLAPISDLGSLNNCIQAEGQAATACSAVAPGAMTQVRARLILPRTTRTATAPWLQPPLRDQQLGVTRYTSTQQGHAAGCARGVVASTEHGFTSMRIAVRRVCVPKCRCGASGPRS